MSRVEFAPYGCGLLAIVLTLSLALPAATAKGQTGGDLYADLSKPGASRAEDHLQATLETLPSRQTRRWHSDDGQESGFVTPMRSFKIKTGHYCRQYLEAISGAGGLRSKVATACRHQNGTWVVIRDKAS